MRACVRVCAQCVGAVCEEVIQYYDYVTIIFEALMNKCFVDLVKRGVLTFVIRRYRAIQRSWFARVNALCNLSRKKSREVAAHFRADF